MIEKFNKEEFLNMMQVNDLLKKFKGNDKEDKEHKSKTWVWVALGVVTVAAGAFALYKLLAPNEFEDFEDEEDFEEFEEFEDEDFEDMDYEESDNYSSDETVDESQSEE
ncbi:hypothetical protein [Vallitalea guaymasensis]|uniref:hypothetical protein n=2 Tax=Vallitalea guaymasensis TaxID=1185412 RepID=UPI000DE2CF03|nr:hypothetical protein [Vallitalea guaymasensis]